MSEAIDKLNAMRQKGEGDSPKPAPELDPEQHIADADYDAWIARAE